ncbi:MAG: glycosyltransferase family 39 protein, partial [Pseudomonadota bacterium]
MNSRWFIFLVLLLLLVGHLFDLSNPNALRQGTEGFYLKISQEMFEQKSFITPLHMGEPHWSKPPLLFWLAMPLYFIFGVKLWAARLSVLIFSILGTWLIARWLRDRFTIPATLGIIFLASSFGFFKYFRIYMMEMPLAILSCLSIFYFYDYWADNRKKDLVLASLFLGLSILVKGPVSLAMASVSAFVFVLTQRKNILAI